MPASSIITQRLSEALVFATHEHRDDVRKGAANTPYIAHVLGVCALVLGHGGTEDQALAALLHDVVEDHGGLGRLDEITDRFGADVAQMVEALSDSTVDTTAAEKPPWWERKVAYIAHVEALAVGGSPALLVSVADKLDNVRATVEDYRATDDPVGFWSMFNAESRGRLGQLWYYRRLHEVFTMAFPADGSPARRLVDELGRAIGELVDLIAEREPDADIDADHATALALEQNTRAKLLCGPEGE